MTCLKDVCGAAESALLALRQCLYNLVFVSSCCLSGSQLCQSYNVFIILLLLFLERERKERWMCWFILSLCNALTTLSGAIKSLIKLVMIFSMTRIILCSAAKLFISVSNLESFYRIFFGLCIGIELFCYFLTSLDFNFLPDRTHTWRQH